MIYDLTKEGFMAKYVHESHFPDRAHRSVDAAIARFRYRGSDATIQPRATENLFVNAVYVVRELREEGFHFGLIDEDLFPIRPRDAAKKTLLALGYKELGVQEVEV